MGVFKLFLKHTIIIQWLYKHWRISKGQSQIDNPEKLATVGTQDEDKQTKSTTQYVLDTTMRKQLQIT